MSKTQSTIGERISPEEHLGATHVSYRPAVAIHAILDEFVMFMFLLWVSTPVSRFSRPMILPLGGNGNRHSAGPKPFVMTNLRTNSGVADVVVFIEAKSMLVAS